MSEARDSVDLVILGAGSAGYSCALRASQLGRSVVLIDSAKLGGTCLHRGCIPTKALLHAGEVADEIRHSDQLGIKSQFEGVDMSALLTYQGSVVEGLYRGLTGLIKTNGISFVQGRGTVVDSHTIEVLTDDGATRHIRGEQLVIATGSRPREVPFAPFSQKVISSDQALRLTEVPKRVLVLGGGVIGTEFASLWRSLGSEVTIVEALDHLLPTQDPTVSKALERAFAKRGIGLKLGVRVAGVAETAHWVSLNLEDGQELASDLLLVAVGRQPVTEGLGLAEVGVGLTHGFVDVNDRFQTTIPSIYAIGDIVAGLQLAHRSFAHGIAAAESISEIARTGVDDETIPQVVYSSPQVASVGLTEPAARKRFGDQVATIEYSLAGNGKSKILGTTGLVKLVRRTDGPIVGVHMVGDRMSEQIGEAQLMVNWEAYPQDITPLLHAHPTQNESLGEAALALAGTPLHAHN